MIFEFPDVGEGIHEGIIVTWLKQEGDTIKEDEPIVEVETDKAVVEIPSPASGILKKQFYKVGDTAIVHQPLCEIQTTDSKPSEVAPESQGQTPTSETPPDGSVVGSLEDADNPTSKALNLDFSSYNPTANPTTAPTPNTNTNPIALPKIKRLAQELNLDLSQITPSGPNNQITEQDLLNFSQSSSNNAQPLSSLRKIIARNMQTSKNNSVQVTHQDDIPVNALIAKRETLKPEAANQNLKLTFLPFIIQAIIQTLNDFPVFNASYNAEQQTINYHSEINIGIAIDTPQGLIVPVIHQAEQKSLFELASTITQLADHAKNRTLKPEDLQNSTITITNYGSIGGKYATPVLNPPNLVNIGLGKFYTHLKLENGQVTEETLLPISITYDHQIIDGADTARFTNQLNRNLQLGNVPE